MSRHVTSWPCPLSCLFLALVLWSVETSAQKAASTQLYSVERAQQLMKQVDALHSEGRYRAAIPIAQEALAIRQRLLGPEHPDTATSLNMLGRIYRYAGDYRQAEPLLKQALALREKILEPDNPAIADSLNNLAGLYHMLDDFKRATPLYLRALRIRERRLGPNHPDTAVSLGNLGLMYARAGAFSQAAPLYQRALNIQRRALGPNHPSTLMTLGWQGNLYFSNGQYSKAEETLLRALGLREKSQGKTHPDVGMLLEALAYLYRHTGAYSRSEAFYRRAIDIFESTLGSEHAYTIGVLGNLAQLYTKIGAYERAEALYERVLAAKEKHFSANSLIVSYTLNNLAELYLASGDYSKVKTLLERSLAIKHSLLEPQRPTIANSLHNLARFYLYTGEFALAESTFRAALAIREKTLGPEHPGTAETLSALASVAWADRRPADALLFLRRAQSIYANRNARFLLVGSEARKREYLQAAESEIFKYVSFSLAVPGSDNVALGLDSVLQHKGRALDLVAEHLVQLRHSMSAEDKRLLQERAELAGELSTLAYASPSDETLPENYRERTEALNAKLEKLDATLGERSQDYRRAHTPVRTPDIRQALPARTALVEWFRYVPVDPREGRRALLAEKENKARYVAYVVQRDADPIALDLGPAQPIEAAVHAFRTAVSDLNRDNLASKTAALSALLVKPLSAHLNRIDHLLASPDGALNLVPLAALYDDTGHYLVERFNITYLTSGRDLLRSDRPSKSRHESVVIADPDFGRSSSLAFRTSSSTQGQRSPDLDRGGWIFRPLANTSLEASELAGMLKLAPSNVLLQGNATESRLKQLHGPRILHLATHGFFLSDQAFLADAQQRASAIVDTPIVENPLLRSGLALAGANVRRSGPHDDGIFTALEAAQLDLQGTELVVLSACDSAVGEVQNGDGVYGLRRALVLAGAQTQISSLWKVSDQATRLLMVDFYRRLLHGEGRSDALRHAQHTLLADPAFAHPYYWAGFLPIGNWTPLPAQP